MDGENNPQQSDLAYVNTAKIHISDEEITVVLYSGTAAHHFGFAPKHFKRFKDLVDEKYKEYSTRFGEIS